MLAPPLNAAHLLRVEHDVAEALLASETAEAAFPLVLAAIGEGLEWRYGGLWLPVAAGALQCVETWTADSALTPFATASRTLALAAGAGLPGRVRETGRPAWIEDVTVDPNFPRGRAAVDAGLHAAFAIPLQGTGGVMEFLTDPVRAPDDALLATLTSLGRQVGQFVSHRRAEAAVHASEARKRAMLDAALDAVITIDAGGRIVEVNSAVQDVFGYVPHELIGRELAAALVPEHLRERHRNGLANGGDRLLGQRVEISALRKDGREFPVELTITRIDVPGPPMYTGYIRDITERVQRTQELKASRARIVAAADEARRRLERDLHDGAQNRLLAVGLELKVLQNRLSEDSAEHLARVRQELQLAVEELRELARGIHPAVLTELGLIAALRTLVRRAPLPVGLHYDQERRCPAPVEAAAYFLAAEALTNVVRYAHATRADITVDLTADALTIEITDDGRGGADPAKGSGLRGMADRLTALDGTLEVISRDGTRITGVIPCA